DEMLLQRGGAGASVWALARAVRGLPGTTRFGFMQVLLPNVGTKLAGQLVECLDRLDQRERWQADEPRREAERQAYLARREQPAELPGHAGTEIPSTDGG